MLREDNDVSRDDKLPAEKLLAGGGSSKLAAESFPEALPGSPGRGASLDSANADAEEDYAIEAEHRPSAEALWAVRLITGQPRRVLSVIFAVFCVSAYAAMELESWKKPTVYIRKDGMEDFANAEERMVDIFVEWCDTGSATSCAAGSGEGGPFAAAQTQLTRLREALGECKDLEWSSASRPQLGLAESDYVSEDGSTAVLEFSSESSECMKEARKRLSDIGEEAMWKNSGLQVALGGAESVAQASMDREGEDSWKHMACSVPFIAGVLILVLGNGVRPFTPLLCMAATFATTRALLMLAKLIWPILNIDMDDPAMFFIAFALNADYALFFWTRFAEERARHPQPDSYGLALELAFLRSGSVIVISNVVMACALAGTLCFPKLNPSGHLAFLIEVLCGVVLANVYSLTLTPAMASAFPKVFDEGDSLLRNGIQICCLNFCPQPKPLWKSWAKIITRRPWLCLLPLLVFVGLLPFISAAGMFEANHDVLEICSNHDTKEFQAYEQLSSHFDMGRFLPVDMVLEARELARDGTATYPASLVEKPSLQVGDYLARLAALAATFNRTATGHNASVTAGNASAAPGNANSTASNVRDLGAQLSAASVRQLALAMEGHGGSATNMLQREMHIYQAGARRSPLWQPGPEVAAAALSSMAHRAEPAVVLSVEFGRAACNFIEDLIAATKGKDYEVRPNQVLGPWWVPGIGVNGASGCLLDANSSLEGGQLNRNMLKRLQQEVTARTSTHGKKMLFTISPAFSPTGPAAGHFSYLLRDNLEKSARAPFTVDGRLYELLPKHNSVVSIQIDTGREMEAAAPYIYGLVCLVGFCSVGFTFRSAFLPIKLALTVTVPLIATYGFVIAVYQLGWFKSLGFGLTGHGLDAITLFTTPCCLFGLAMDYDLFLFVRVYEYRSRGYDNRSSVERALVETGPVITTAGTLFVISLFFLTLSKTPMMKFMGAIYLTGLCFDVFVVRTIIAPAFLCMAEHLNYWPGKMPRPTKRWPRAALQEGGETDSMGSTAEDDSSRSLLDNLQKACNKVSGEQVPLYEVVAVFEALLPLIENLGLAFSFMSSSLTTSVANIQEACCEEPLAPFITSKAKQGAVTVREALQIHAASGETKLAESPLARGLVAARRDLAFIVSILELLADGEGDLQAAFAKAYEQELESYTGFAARSTSWFCSMALPDAVDFTSRLMGGKRPRTEVIQRLRKLVVEARPVLARLLKLFEELSLELI